jgi:hypothetical protein
MTKLLDDLCCLTTVATYNMTQLRKLSESIIGHAVSEGVLDNEEIVEIDIGIGTLYIKIEDDIKYKFIPSDKLSSVVKQAVETRTSPLNTEIDETLGKRIMNTYKDLF